tara:strand:- start:8429 stop:8605 length:177 start_codon:yes stop_codon:yes gene_type:complete
MNIDHYEMYNESYIDEAKQMLNELSKIPDAAWTLQDFSKYVSALNTLHAIRQLKEVAA